MNIVACIRNCDVYTRSGCEVTVSFSRRRFGPALLGILVCVCVDVCVEWEGGEFIHKGRMFFLRHGY
jgi:hypothetical protein